MMSRQHLRPDLDQSIERAALYVSGTLDKARPGKSYESRLTIHNAIGACTVLQTDGDTLPNGAQIYVDNDTSEVVIAWPAYAEGDPYALTNAGFELGDTSGWTVTTTGTRDGYETSAGVSTDNSYAGSYCGSWTGSRGYGHAGGVEAVWENEISGDCYPLQQVTASAMIWLVDTGVSQNRGAVRLNWYDSTGELIKYSEGNLIRGNSSGWRQSSLTTYAPSSAETCKLAIWTTANYSGGVRVDAGTWDLPTSVGTDQEGTYDITIRVRDSAGRTAFWSGGIAVIKNEYPLPAQLGDWRYLQTTQSDSTDYSGISYDDSGWPVGYAPFGGWDADYGEDQIAQGAPGGFTYPQEYNSNFAVSFASTWETRTRLWLRRILSLSDVPLYGYRCTAYIEDNFEVYVNGELVATSVLNPVGGNGLQFNISSDSFVAGDNVIAIKCDDELSGSGISVSYFDIFFEELDEPIYDADVKIRATAEYSDGVGATTHDLPLPEYAIGDLLIAFVEYRHASSAPDTTAPSGWIRDAYLAHTPAAFATYRRIADGTEGETLTITRSVTLGVSALIASIEARTYSEDHIRFVSGKVSGVTSIDVPSFGSTAPFSDRDSLVIAALGSNGKAQPTSWPLSSGHVFIASSGTYLQRSMLCSGMKSGAVTFGSWVFAANANLMAATYAIGQAGVEG